MAKDTLKAIEENRTFKCLQNDESIDLNDLTPVHLNNRAYWEPVSYTAKDQNKSEVKLTFTVSPTTKVAITIPAGFRVSNADASIIFTTVNDAVIPAATATINDIVARSLQDHGKATANTIQVVKSTFNENGVTLSVTNPAAATGYTPSVTEGDKVHITDEQAVNRNEVADVSVTAGVYECVSPDYDILKEKATIANKQVPLCFKRSIEITLTEGRTQVVYPWSKKWQRVGDLPSKASSDEKNETEKQDS